MTEFRAESPPYALAAVVAAAVLVVYIATLAPTVQFWDAPEYMAASHSLGIPHPPGNPLFVLLAHVWGLLPLARDYGARINLLAATTSAAAAGFWFLIAERWLRPIVPAVPIRRLVAAAGALVGATAFTVWNQSVVNEKVYTISLLSITLVLWLAIRWADHPAPDRPDRLLVLITYVLVLTSANHQMGLLAAPAVLVLVAGTDVRAALRPRLLGLALAAAAFAVTVYLLLPIRAHLDPYLNEGNPSTWAALKDVLLRTQYGKPPLTHRQADLGGQLLLWVQYFTWQWGHDLRHGVAQALAAAFGALGLLGAWRHWRAERRQAAVMLTLMVTLTIALVFYLNFRYGYSEFPGRSLDREVRERDYFFIASFSAWGVWVAMGLATLMEWVTDALAARLPASTRWRLATPVLFVALVPLVANRLSAARSGETMSRDFAYDLLQSVDPYAIVVTAGDNDTFPLWYAQEVDGVRRDVTVLVTSLGNLNWFLRQMQQRPIAPFDSTAAPALYRGRFWPKPTTPWLGAYYLGATGDSLPQYAAVDQTVTGQLGPIRVSIDPQRLPQPGYLSRVDLALLHIVRNQLGHRPIYFSTTTASYPEQLGFGPYLVTEGMVRRLQSAPVVASDSIRLSHVQGRYVNVPRTTRLAFEVYHGTVAARPRPRGWVDRASENILLPYIVTYDTIAELLQRSDPPRAAQALALARAIMTSTDYQFDLSPPTDTP
jgi:hypothetical protein